MDRMEAVPNQLTMVQVNSCQEVNAELVWARQNAFLTPVPVDVCSRICTPHADELLPLIPMKKPFEL